MPPEVGVIIVAGGRGVRMGIGTPKQFLLLQGIAVLQHTLRPFVSHRRIGPIVVVIPPEFEDDPPDWLAAIVGTRVRVAAGGPTRADSVAVGLRALPAEVGIVLVHDGVRPLVSQGIIERVIDAATDGYGAVAGIPVVDTLKRCEGPPEQGVSRVTRTEPRGGLWQAQTPQGFPRRILEEAYAMRQREGVEHVEATDDAELVERMGATIVMVRGSRWNIKVTTPEDLAFAEAYLEGSR